MADKSRKPTQEQIFAEALKQINRAISEYRATGGWCGNLQYLRVQEGPRHG